VTDALVAVEDRDGGVRWLTLDRPDVRNAIDVALQAALAAALHDAAADSAVRAIVLTGAGSAFSAGADLSRFDETDPIAFRWASHDLTTTIGLVERIEKPVVAAINGVATGAGLQLALACDLRIASDRARLLWRESALGLLLAHGGIARLVHLVALGPARDLVLGGGDLDAQRAHHLGLLTAVVAHDALTDAVDAALARILERGLQAYAAAKRVLAIAAATDVHTGMLAETLGQSLLVGTADHQERLEAARRRSR
jgi:enoyl-CoA hydratase/carnithine racemase